MAGWDPLIFPVLAVSGLLALPWTGTRRNVLVACWLVQLVLIVLLCAAGVGGADLLRPRRFQAIDVMSIALVLAAMRVAPPVLRGSLVAVLLAGNAWTLADGAQFARTAFMANPFSRPGVVSIEGVGTIDPPSIEWAKRLEARARAGERVVVLHGQMCLMESVTNPFAVLERLYVLLGPQMFHDRVLGVAMPADVPARYVTVPVVDVRTAMDTLAPGTIVEVDTLCADRMADVRQQLATRFTLVPLEPEDARILRYRLEPLPVPSARS
jgi:hypothetical protein